MDTHERAQMLELARATRDKLRGKLTSGRYEDEALRQMARLQIEALSEILREADLDPSAELSGLDESTRNVST